MLPVGRPGGRVARDNNAMCWDRYLLWCAGKRGSRPREDGRPATSAWSGGRVLRRWRDETTPRMRMALPMGRAAHGASLGVPGVVPPGEPGRRLQEPAPGSGVHTHRQVVAGPVCRGIVMRAAINAMLRQPALLLQFAGPSLRRAVTAPSVSRSAQWPQPCSSGRVSWGCWLHSAVRHAPGRSARWAAASSACAGSVPDAVARPHATQALRLACWAMEKAQTAHHAGCC